MIVAIIIFLLFSHEMHWLNYLKSVLVDRILSFRSRCLFTSLPIDMHEMDYFKFYFRFHINKNDIQNKMTTVKNRLMISFVVAWIAYALTYFLRKPLGVVRDLIYTLFFFLCF